MWLYVCMYICMYIYTLLKKTSITMNIHMYITEFFFVKSDLKSFSLFSLKYLNIFFIKKS